MKKLLCFLLAITMIFALSACGKSEKAEDVNDVAENATDVAEKEFSLGETDGNVYKNEFIGLGYTKADDWEFYTREQIMSINNIAQDMVGEDVEAILENADIIYDMYVASPTQLENININLEKLDRTVIDALDISANYEKLVPTLKSAFENMGATGFEYEHATVTIENEKFDGLKIKCNISGIDMYQLSFQKKCGSYLVNITVSSCVEDTTEKLIDNFFFV